MKHARLPGEVCWRRAGLNTEGSKAYFAYGRIEIDPGSIVDGGDPEAENSFGMVCVNLHPISRDGKIGDQAVKVRIEAAAWRNILVREIGFGICTIRIIESEMSGGSTGQCQDCEELHLHRSYTGDF